MNDEVFVSGLTVQGIVGVYPEERKAPRELLVDLVLSLDLSAAGRSDALEDTVDYDRVAQLARTLAAQRHHALVEHYAERLAAQVLALDPHIRAVEVTVHKPGAVAGTRSVGVRLRRRRGEGSGAE